MLGFFIQVKRFSKIVKNLITMQLSTQTTNHISSFSKTANLYIGNCMGKVCRVAKNSRIEAIDYQSFKSSCHFRDLRKQRVKEIKFVLV